MAEQPVPVRPPLALPPAGYEVGDLIGKGGMGEVVAARDRRIGRDVAIKRMSGTASERATLRFLREARIQARLDHPAIVPVHELGVDDQGRPFFTMKRLAGRTLAEELVRDVPTQALLRAFVDVCMAVRLAHARRIVHRDLKPANIMLGDYGEVYVLDWGVARELEAPDDDARGVETPEPPDSRGPDRDGPEDSLVTREGVLLGTPGYIPPEQVRGDTVGTPADIYALGAILFEILAREPLHPRGKEALVSTLSGELEAPARRCPERAIAPELDELCLAMLAEDPAARPDAQQVADRLRRYLDGDRDLERRRVLAAEQLAAARAAEDRASALRHAGRALALDPESPEAANLVMRMLMERPKQLPPGLVAELDQLDREALKTRSRRAARSYALVFAFLAWLPFVGVQSWSWLVAFYATLTFMVGFAWRGIKDGSVSPYVSMLGNAALALMWTRIASPFVLTPAMICGALIAIASHPWNQQRPLSILGWALVTVLTPFALEWTGVLASTWDVEAGILAIRSNIYALDGAAAASLLLVANLLFLLLVGGFAYVVTQRARNAQRELQIQSWNLRQLVPPLPA